MVSDEKLRGGLAMNLMDLPTVLDIDVQGSLEERFMGSEALYVRFLKKLLLDTNIDELQQAFVEENWDEVLRKAHNLKGVCANLGLNSLSKDFAAVVTEIRNGDYKAQDLKILLQQALAEWNKTMVYLGQLE